MNVNRLINIITILMWGWLLQDDSAYHLNDHYYVCISPQFAPSWTNPILEGIAVWNQFGENRFYLSSDGLCDVLIAPATGKVAKRLEQELKDPYVLGYADFPHNTIYLFMDKVYGETDLMNLVSHEAGHFIGLQHIPMKRFAIMNPYRRYYGYIHPHLFRADIEEYCRIWNCPAIDYNSIDDTVSYGIVNIPDAGIN